MQQLPRRTATCVIAGGGPAGIVLGLLLARAGIDVTVLEKHADFLRDFRGDTVHPTTLGLLDDLGIFGRFEQLPQSKVRRVQFLGAEGNEVTVADFGRLPLRHPYVAMVPQWDLLTLLADTALAEPCFTLLTEHEATGVLRERGRVCGLSYRCPDGVGEVAADLTVACDGRWSTVRRDLGLEAKEFPVGFDVWWYRLSTSKRVGESLLPRIHEGQVAIGIPRSGYLQVAQLGLKGEDALLRARGIEAFRDTAARIFPELAEDVVRLDSMDAVKHLDVRVDRLRTWHAPGALCLGDAAHVMSPVGGVGINLAIQDAVAAARILARPLGAGGFQDGSADRFLAKVQRRRNWPAALIQAVQRIMHAAAIMPALRGGFNGPPKWFGTMFAKMPFLSTLPALVIGIGPRPEKAPTWARRFAPPPHRQGSTPTLGR